MPRPVNHPGSAYKIPVMVKLNPEALAALDKLRGKTPRSTYMRDLLRADMRSKRDQAKA